MTIEKIEIDDDVFEAYELPICIECGAEYPEAGDGWDGMCPQCADEENARQAAELQGDCERDER